MSLGGEGAGPVENLQVLPTCLLCALSRLPASCVLVPQGPFPQPLSGLLNRRCEEAALAAPEDLGEEEIIPRSFLSNSKKFPFLDL